MPYPGGKSGSGVYQRIINEIPPHDMYIEPCLGGGAVLRLKRPAARSIGIDLDADALGQCRDVVPGLDLLCCDGTAWLKFAFGLHRLPLQETPQDPPPVDRAAGDGKLLRSRKRAAPAESLVRSPNPQASPGLNSAGKPSAVRLQEQPHDPAAEYSNMLCVPNSRAFVYWDPPYPLGSRKSPDPLYRFEMTDQQHVDLLETAKRLPCPVMLSTYPNDLYESNLHGWRKITFQAMTRRGPATEVLWMNYPHPAELHDYRYVGSNKRQRERIRRKVKTWAAGLKRLPEHERRAILAELSE